MGEGSKRTKAKSYQTSLTSNGDGVGVGGAYEGNLLTDLPAEEQIELDCFLSPNASPPPVGSSVKLLDRGKNYVEVYRSVAKIGDIAEAGSTHLRNHYDFDKLTSKNIQAKVTQVSPEWGTFSITLTSF